MTGMLDGKVAIITGAGSGIGEAAAHVFARHGAKIVIGELNADRGETVADAIRRGGGEAFSIGTDVSKEAEVERMVAFAVEKFGRLDCAFNNAGIGVGGAPVTGLEREGWDMAYQVDLIGPWLCMKYEIPQMLKTGGGAIVNNASNAGRFAVPNMAPYGAVKAGVISITQTAAVEFGGQNIRVNAICPGVIETAPILAAKAAGLDFLKQFQIPLERGGKPEEVGELAAFLVSSRSSYISGQAISIDGGQSACQ